MCGITGYKLLSVEHAHQAADLFEKLLLECQVRGKHATGVSWASGGRTRTFKKSMPAIEFVDTDKWKSIKANTPLEMIGHTRYSTSGVATVNLNNQPLAVGELSIVHNGLVSMGTKAEFNAAYGVKTITENDTEVILWKTLKAREKNFSDCICSALESIHEVDPPIFACGFLECTPGQTNVYAVRDHIRPLWLFYIKPWAMLGFASTEDIITRALHQVQPLRLEDVAIWPADPYTVYTLGKDILRTAVKLPFSYPTEHRFERPNLIERDILINKEATGSGHDLALDNPDYRQGDHRQNLRESFKRYSAAAVASWEIDPNYPMMNYLFRRYELSKSQEYWACFLYGVFYHPGSVFYVMQEFPEFEKVDLGRLERWHAANWQQLRYNKDRKYEKGHFVEMFRSYLEMIGKQTPTAQEEFFDNLLEPGDPYTSFRNITKALLKLRRFGRYSVYIYTECLARCMGLPMMADTMFLKEANSPRAGLCYATNRPDWAKATLTADQWKQLELDADVLLAEINGCFPNLRPQLDPWFMESCLCAFKGFFANGRYLGYYIHRMADEILQMETASITSGIDWRVLWQFRHECLPWEYLGELHSPKILKVKNEWRHTLAETGYMIGMWPMIKRGVIPQTPLTKARSITTYV